MGARLSATAVELEAPPLPGPFAGAFVMEGAVATEAPGEYQQGLSNATRMLDGLEASARSSDVACSHTVAPCVMQDIGAVLIDQSHVKDLTLIAVKEHDGGQEKLIDSLLFEFRAAGAAVLRTRC